MLNLNTTPYLAVSVSYKFDLANLLEFIEYHRLVGVQKFYICNNDDQPKMASRAMRPYIEQGIVENLLTAKMKWGQNRQAAAHNHVLTLARKDKVKWLAMLDMDEFIYPIKFNTVTEILKTYEDSPALQINYACFGSSGYEYKQILQTDSYIRRAYDGWEWNRLTKALGQVDKISHCDHHHYFKLHNAKNGKKTHACDEDKKPCGWVKSPKMKYLRINHYLCRSKEDYRDKMVRGNPLGEARTWKWFHWADRNEVYDDGMRRRFVPQLLEVLQNNKYWYNTKDLIKLV